MKWWSEHGRGKKIYIWPATEKWGRLGETETHPLEIGHALTTQVE